MEENASWGQLMMLSLTGVGAFTAIFNYALLFGTAIRNRPEDI